MADAPQHARFVQNHPLKNMLTTPAIKAHSIRASLGNAEVLHGIDLSFPRGHWTSIVGPNGAGKSTLLKVMAGLLPHTGCVTLLGQPLSDLSGRMRGQKLAWLGQNETTGEDLIVRDVVVLGRLPHQSWLAGASDADHKSVEQALRATQAWEWRGRALGQLSAGERQRVLLARALAVQAQVLLMDEPLANLDPQHQADWLEIVRTLIREGKTVVSVLHEISFALHADQMLIMDKGKVTYQGACADAQIHHTLEKVFEHRIAIHAVGDQWAALPTN